MYSRWGNAFGIFLFLFLLSRTRVGGMTFWDFLIILFFFNVFTCVHYSTFLLKNYSPLPRPRHCRAAFCRRSTLPAHPSLSFFFVRSHFPLWKFWCSTIKASELKRRRFFLFFFVFFFKYDGVTILEIERENKKIKKTKKRKESTRTSLILFVKVPAMRYSSVIH